MQKQIWELTENDFNLNPVWYFPIEGEDTDEATVLPASEAEATNINNMLLVPAYFVDSASNECKGYIYWSKPELIENLQPCMFSAGEAISFWFGLSEPEENEIKTLNFPISVRSAVVFGLKQINIELEGYYYINQAGKAVTVRPTS